MKFFHGSVTIQLKAKEQYLPAVMFILPYKVVPTFDSVDTELSNSGFGQ